MKKIIAAVAALVCLPVVGLLLGGSLVSRPSGCGDAAVLAGGGPVDDSLGLTGPIPPQGTQRFFTPVDAEQTAISQTVVGVVKGRNLPLRAAVLTLAAGAQESQIHNLDYGDRDSLGYLQQRPSMGWPNPRDVPTATNSFLDALVQVAGWDTMAATAAIQRVQRSGFPLAYAQWEKQAIDLVMAASGTAPIAPGSTVIPPAGTGCAALPGGAVTADGPIIPPGLVTKTSGWPVEGPTVIDPTGTGGRITPRTAAMLAALDAAGYTDGGASCWDLHLWNPLSDHPLGLACDVFFAHPDPAAIAHGWAAANYLVAHQAELGVKYLIWQGRYWDADRPGEWTDYHSKIYGCPNPKEINGCHYNHIHVSMY